MNENADFAAILRRRLFDNGPAREVIDATSESFDSMMRDRGWRAKVLEHLGAPWTTDFAGQVARAYPFHPQLMHLAESEWREYGRLREGPLHHPRVRRDRMGAAEAWESG